MVEIDITLSRIEDSVILISGETAKTVETDTQFINYFFFSATSIDYTASTMTLKYDAHADWVPDACLVVCTNDPSSETYAIRITSPKFSSSTSSVEYRTVYAEGRIQTASPLVSSSYNIGVKTNGCPEVERFILSYETFDDDSEKIAEYNENINFNVEYIIEKNIDNFTDADPSAKMLHIAARRVWDVNDSDFDRYAYGEQTLYTKENYTCSEDLDSGETTSTLDSGETTFTLGKNTRIYRNDNVVELGAGFYHTYGSSFGKLLYTTTYREIEDGGNTMHRVDLEFNWPLEAIGYHTFYLGKHYNVSDVPDEDKDGYIAYSGSADDSYYYFPGEKSADVNRNTFFDGKLDCTYIEQTETEKYVEYDGAKRSIVPQSLRVYSESNQNEYLFEESDNIKGIKTGKYLRIIGNQAFKKLRNLEYIDFENSPLERIGMYAFEGCTSLSAITVPDTVSLIGEGAFKRSGIESVEIPSGITMIEAETFRLCKNLEEVDFSNCTRLYKICNDAFRGCWHIYGLTFPSSLERIERMAFANCDGIDSITFNSGLKHIGYRAFDKCNSLESVTIPAKTIGERSFNRCKNLKEVTLENGVDIVGSRAFYKCNITALTINEGVKVIEDYAFYEIGGITSITLPNTVLSIGEGAFANNYSLETINIPNGITEIRDFTFSNCQSLTSITIPDSVTSIGKQAFNNCTSLASISYTGTVSQWNSITKGYGWHSDVPATVVHCTDGDVNL